MVSIQKRDFEMLKSILPDLITKMKRKSNKTCEMADERNFPVCENPATYRLKFGFAYGYMCEKCAKKALKFAEEE